MKFKRYFTPQEANQLLPRLQDQLEAVSESVQWARRVAEALQRAEDEEEREQMTKELQRLESKIQEQLQRLSDEGVEVKGVLPLLLDFPAWRNGKEVYLCWKEGEREIAWWHPLHGGIRGRQALTQDDSWEWVN